MNRQILNMKSMFVIYMCLLAAISLPVSSMASNSAFAQGTTESDAAAGEEAQSIFHVKVSIFLSEPSK
jgi:hypothetical protein